MISEELRKARLSRAKAFTEGKSPAAEQIATIAKKADDLDAALKSVSDAAALGAPLWLSYIFLLFYIAIAAGAVTHKELLLESPVELPFLSIKLPLKAFFLLAPALFLIVHAYVMAHFAMLAGKAKAFADLLRLKVPGDSLADHAIRDALRRQLPINVFAQFLVGPSDIRKGGFSLLLWIIAWTTLVVGPILVLLLLQLQFLPYHAPYVTLWHRGVLILDLVFIWWLWMRILAGRDAGGRQVENGLSQAWDVFLWSARYVLAVPLTAVIVFFSVFVATFPGEWEEEPAELESVIQSEKESDPDNVLAEHEERAIPSPGKQLVKATHKFMMLIRPWVLPATEFVFGKVDALGDFSEGTETPALFGDWPMNRLRLLEFDIYAGLGVKGADDLKWKPYTFSLKDRRLEQIDLRRARLDNIDLRHAQMKGARLNQSRLAKADFFRANLEGASLKFARLQGALLLGAYLSGASLENADLQGTTFSKAHLLGASLVKANLQGASLKDADLHGADLLRADLRGARLRNSRLPGASLKEANAIGASFDLADLRGASIESAQLQGASLGRANLQGSFLEKARLQGASFVGAYLWRVNLGTGAYELNHIQLDKAHWTLISEPEDFFDSGTAYDRLKGKIEALLQGGARADALKRLARLNCKAAVDEQNKPLASCDPGVPEPKLISAWRKLLESAATDETTYAADLAERLRGLVCEGSNNAIHILRGVAGQTTIDSRLTATGREAPRLIADILEGKNCPVSKELTDADKARLNEIKAEMEKK